MRWVFVVIGLLVLTSLACGAEAAMVPAQTAGQAAGITAQGAAQAAAAGAVVASDMSSTIEGDSAQDWDAYNLAKAELATKYCIERLRNRDPNVEDCTVYYCDDVKELMVVCNLKDSEDVVVYTYANFSGCFDWKRVPRRGADSERNIRGCKYYKTL